MPDLSELSILSDLSSWLRNPVIKLSPTDEVEQLRSQLNALQKDYDAIRSEYEMIQIKYRDLTMHCCDLRDLLRLNGIRTK